MCGFQTVIGLTKTTSVCKLKFKSNLFILVLSYNNDNRNTTVPMIIRINVVSYTNLDCMETGFYMCNTTG